jgi:hypothetical protein
MFGRPLLPDQYGSSGPPALKMEADRSSETHVNFKQNTRRHIPEECSSAPNEACDFKNVHNTKVFYNFPANHKICGKNILAIKGVSMLLCSFVANSPRSYKR